MAECNCRGGATNRPCTCVRCPATFGDDGRCTRQAGHDGEHYTHGKAHPETALVPCTCPDEDRSKRHACPKGCGRLMYCERHGSNYVDRVCGPGPCDDPRPEAVLSPDPMRPFPMQWGPPIPWYLAEAIYTHLYRHTSQTLERIAERGGFGWQEVSDLWRRNGGKRMPEGTWTR